MVVGNVPEAADFVVAGAGPGGYVAAIRAAQAGRKVLLVEARGEDGVGGVCLRVGCIPSKTLIEAADLRHRMGRAGEMGLDNVETGFDMARFQSFKTDVIGRLTDGVRSLLSNAGVEVVAGSLALTDSKTAVINLADGNVRFVKFRDLVLATGSSPIALPHLPFDGERVLDSTGVLALAQLPESLAIIGAGYVGVEIGIAFAKLGCAVSIVEQEDSILPGMDKALARPVAESMEALGISLLLNTRATGFDDGVLAMESNGSGIPVDKVMVAVGRSPNTENIGLRQSGIEVGNDGRLPVAPDRRVTPHIAAIGDVTPGPALAHKAMAEAEVAVDALCGKPAAFDPGAIPEIVFSDPEVASAGLTEDEAKTMELEVKVASFPIAASGRAATLGERRGFVRVVADAADGTLLGVQMASAHASDLIAEAVLAIEMGASLEDLALTIHAHPTLSEPLAEAAMTALGRPLHVSS